MGSLFKTPKMPEMPPEVPMPDPEDLASKRARMKMLEDATKKKGREFHTFGAKGRTLGPTVAEGGGGTEYSRGTLGGTPM
jgi:hypothetical protein